MYSCNLSYFKKLISLSLSLNFFFVLRCYLFRSWGRVGTTIGDNKLENFEDAAAAVEAFKELYLEKTGNAWKDRKNFVKKAGRLYPLDIDYGQVIFFSFIVLIYEFYI